MALVPLEVLIYALVITGKPVPAECNLRPDKSVACTNGVIADEAPQAGGIVFNGTIKVQTARDGRLLFSNGITATRLATGWIRFSSGIETRKDTSGAYNAFLVAPDLLCAEVSETKAVCKKR